MAKAAIRAGAHDLGLAVCRRRRAEHPTDVAVLQDEFLWATASSNDAKVVEIGRQLEQEKMATESDKAAIEGAQQRLRQLVAPTP